MDTVKINLLEVLSSRQPKVGKTLFIAVDGHGGAGKSTLAVRVASRLGAQIIRQDDFASWDNPFDWWPLIVERIFNPIRDGAKTLSYPRSKWWENHHPKPVIDQAVTDFMILEGVGSLRREFRDYVSLGIFVDTPKHICLQRGVDRDSKTTGKTRQELTKMWNGWFDEEDKHFKRDNPQANADIVLDGTRRFEDQIW